VNILYRYEKENSTTGGSKSTKKTPKLIRPGGGVVVPSNPSEHLLVERQEAHEASPSARKHEDLLKRWRYIDKRCRNDAPYCFIEDNQHYPLSTQDAKAWAAVAGRDDSGRINKEHPPESLMIKFRKDMKAQKKEEKKKEQYTTPAPFGGPYGYPAPAPLPVYPAYQAYPPQP